MADNAGDAAVQRNQCPVSCGISPSRLPFNAIPADAAPTVAPQLRTSPLGALVALAAVLSTALYQLWAGSKQRDLDASSAQLLHQSAPFAAVFLAALVAAFEPVTPSTPGGGETRPSRSSIARGPFRPAGTLHACRPKGV